MASALSIVSLASTSISVVIFAGLYVGYMQGDAVPIGHFTFLIGFVLSGLSLITGDRSRVAKISFGLCVAIFALTSVAFIAGFICAMLG